jgi:EmrB/QacA subfamily drug resistance transporter
MSHAQAVADNPDYKWWVLGIVMIGTLMGALDSSIVNVSIPRIMADFGSSVDDIEWVVTGYMLAFSTLMPLTTWMRDRVGHKSLFIASLFVFTLGSLLCGMAWNLPSLIVARVIQALGGGAITPTGMAMIAEVFPQNERGKAMGYWGVGVIVGPAFGPTLGGYLTQTLGWRSIFLINLPIGIAGMLLASKVLFADKPHASQSKPFDFWGFGFLSAFLVAFLLGLSKGEHEGWTSVYILTCAIVSLLGFVGFLLVELQIPNPIVELSLFKSSVFSVCMVVTVVRSVALYGGVFLLPLFLQNQMGFDETQSGLLMLPGSLVIGLFMPISGKISDRTGPRTLTIVGLIGVALFMYMYRNMDINMSVMDVINPTLVRGFGIGLLIAPVMAAALNSVPTQKAGAASAMLNLLQQVGGSLGIAVLATVLSHRTRFHLNVIGSAVHSGSPAFQAAFGRTLHHALRLGYSHVEAGQVAASLVGAKIAQSATVLAFQDSFLVGAGIVAIAILPSLLLPASISGHAELDLSAME